jgi:hypothetical protein
VYVLNGAVPSTLPQGNLLLIAPPDSPLIHVTGQATNLAVTSQENDSLLVRYADLSSVSIASASRMQPPDWMQVLASSGDVPLLAAGEQAGSKVVAMAFSPEQSDLPLQVAFPILVQNLVNYLEPQAALADTTVQAGLPVALPASNLTVTEPDGRNVRASSSSFADTTEPGIYAVKDSHGNPVATFAVNAGSAAESNLLATDPAPLHSTNSAAKSASSSAGRAWWWPFLAAGIGVMLVEWWLYTRRQSTTLRARRTA